MPTFKNNTIGEENAIEGTAVDGRGVVGISTTDYGMRAHSVKLSGIRASSDEGPGVEGGSKNSVGVIGSSATGEGVRGVSSGIHGGVVGVNNSPTDDAGAGVYGESTKGVGVQGVSRTARSAVFGQNVFIPPQGSPPGTGGNGAWFESERGEGVRGWSKNLDHGGVVGVNTAGGFAVYGTSDNGVGVVGSSVNNEGVHAETQSATTAAVAAFQKNPGSNSAALYAKHEGHKTAAFFEGNVVLTGHINFANAADCAEDFDISADSLAEPGTVMALDDQGNLRASCHAYDKRVAGVVSGAGNYKPGLILDKQQSENIRKPIALLGKVFCKVDAQYSPIEVGDLLTTSPTAGHAMRADDPHKAFGAVIGKALRPLAGGQGLIPILIALQ